MDLRVLTRMAVAGILACLLSACWMSDKPLLTDNTASAVSFTGKYRGDGEEGPQDIALVALGANAYAMADEKGERLPVRFLALKGDWYLMQADGQSDKAGVSDFYLYQVLKVVNGDLNFYSSDCEDLKGKFEGMKREEGMAPSCDFTRLDGLKSAALAYIARIEKGQLAGDPKILKAVP